MRIQLAESLSFRKTHKCAGARAIGRGWCSFLSLRDPAALPGRQGHPTQLLLYFTRWILIGFGRSI